MKNRVSGQGKQLCDCNCHWDLSWLRFGDTRIAAGDVNGLFVVERFGHFLFIETKTDDEPVTEGQRILLEQLSRVAKFTVILIRGPKSWPREVTRIWQGQFLQPETTSREGIQRRVEGWFEIANAQAE